MSDEAERYMTLAVQIAGIAIGRVRDVVRGTHARFLLAVLLLLTATDLAIYFDVPLVRPVLGFFFFTTVPGLLTLRALRLNSLAGVDALLLSAGTSIAFLLIAGLAINTLYPLVGYDTPLSTSSLLLSFSVAIVLLAVVALRPRAAEKWVWPRLNVRVAPFLVIPAVFPLLGIASMLTLNATGDGTLLMVLLSLMPAYIVFVTIAHRRVPEGAFPFIVFFISLSSVLLFGLKSNYAVGVDSQYEYYLFRLTYDNLRWEQYLGNSLDSALSISLLPTVYMSLLRVDPDYLFKLLYPVLFALSPVAVYSIARRYTGGVYAFLAACFSMTPFSFFWTAALARSSVAVLFFTLYIMVGFRGDLSQLARRVMFLVFSAGVILSHYSTSYIFFWLLLTTWIASRVLLPRQAPESDSTPGTAGHAAVRHFPSSSERHTSLVKVALFFALLYLWYQIVTGAAFSSGVGFIRRSLLSLNDVFIMESRAQGVTEAFGQTLAYSEVPVRIKLVFNWVAIISIAIGVLGSAAGYVKSRFLPKSPGRWRLAPFETDPQYQVLSLACCATMVLAVVVPYISEGYGMDRIYSQVLSVLALFCVTGHMIVGKLLRLKPYWLTLLVVIPLFLANSGALDQMFSRPVLLLSFKGPAYERFCTSDEESYAVRWLGNYGHIKTIPVYSDAFGARHLISQGGIRSGGGIDLLFRDTQGTESYVYLRYGNVVEGKYLGSGAEIRDMAEHKDRFAKKSKVYSSGGSEIYR